MDGAELSTADICDQFGDQVTVLKPGLRQFGGVGSFAGRCVTVRCFEDNVVLREALEERGDGRVLCVDGGSSRRTALLGSNIANAAYSRGWAGVVIDGCVRDRAELATISIGILAIEACPRRSGKTGVGEVGATVTVRDARISTGDFMVCDLDGAVVVPAHLDIGGWREGGGT